MVTDPIADMLTRIRNGCRARLDRVDVPASKLKTHIADILKSEGFIADHRPIASSASGSGVIEIKLKYEASGTPVITDLQRVSRCGLRKYLQANEIPKVRNGLGIMIVSTSHGVMTGQAARKANVGGEPLCTVW